jgi:UDP-N-acetylglucosamine--N-acetylmuramyl-(pentapeptide) pyrophosphoryl-undecaprenol N-acetylglucosamine transferase
MSCTGDELNVTIACGGTGGHLFPGLAVAEQLAQRGAKVSLMISAKEVDQVAARTVRDMSVVTLPAVGLTRNHLLPFVRGFIQSYRAASAWLSQHRPQAALAMGGFTSAPPILAAKRFKAATFLHESNSIPGRANRWLSWIVDAAFVGYPTAAPRLHNRCVTVTGTPVRSKFAPRDAAACRAALGFNPDRPMALVMGGSQGAHGINELVAKSLPSFAARWPDWQWFHLAGAEDLDSLRRAYAEAGLTASVHPFFVDMDLAMGGAAACISRAGASSLAEIAAMGLPSVLVPYPAATDDHQFHNARALCDSGAARMLDQRSAQPENLVAVFGPLMSDQSERERMREALLKWHTPQAAEEIARAIVEAVEKRAHRPVTFSARRGKPPTDERVLRGLEMAEFGERNGV